MGQSPDGMYLVETVNDVARLNVATPDHIAFVTQTTLSVDDAAGIIAALGARFPAIVGPKKDDICYATQNRQDAVTQLTSQCDVVIVVGSRNSSNSNRLKEVAVQGGAQAYLVDWAGELDPAWFIRARQIGITAGASAPEVLVNDVASAVKKLVGGEVIDPDHEPEGVSFPLPKSLA
jgi:4-hydroxy-3-methylbut-2-enyl diphosphate reductase